MNGAGKTTSIGKLANRLRKEGLSVILCAADTFRAAAVEQLEIWAQRNGIEVIKQKSGADPAAVVYDAVAAAKARSSDAVIVVRDRMNGTGRDVSPAARSSGRRARRRRGKAPSPGLLANAGAD